MGGRWSGAIGASTHSACSACGAGFYQPATGQASADNCIECGLGRYNSGLGVASCSQCPKGSWSHASGATSCNVCPDGTWTYIEGSLHADDCTPCGHANNCQPGATARVTVQIDGLHTNGLSSTQQADLKNVVAADIAVACGLADAASVWDVQGNHGLVSFADGGIEAWVEVPQNSYAN